MSLRFFMRVRPLRFVSDWFGMVCAPAGKANSSPSGRKVFPAGGIRNAGDMINDFISIHVCRMPVGRPVRRRRKGAPATGGNALRWFALPAADLS